MKLYTSAAIARTLGLTAKEVEALTKTGVIKDGYTKRGLYKLEETAREIIQNLKKPEEDRENVDYATERAKMMRIKRLNEEYDLEIKRKQLVRADEAELLLTKMMVSFKSKLLGIPARTAKQIAVMSDSIEIMDLLKEKICEALEEMSDIENVLRGDEGGK